MKRGIYLTEYGNSAYVAGPKARRAYDLDMAEVIPMALVTANFLRAALPFDEAVADEAIERSGRIAMAESDCEDDDA